jgi:CMP/dCMP kinase
MIITIDGPAGAGKGTIAQFLAGRFGLDHLDSGLLYRVVAYRVIEANIAPEDIGAVLRIAEQTTAADTRIQGLRSEEVASVASQIAVIPQLRTILTDLQRVYCEGVPPPYKGVVLDGRDCGTVVFPHARCKLFVTARPEVRAKRRLLEAEAAPGDKQHMVDIICTRDARDSARKVAPLTAAPDAYILDTSDLTIEEACNKATSYVNENCLSRHLA